MLWLSSCKATIIVVILAQVSGLSLVIVHVCDPDLVSGIAGYWLRREDGGWHERVRDGSVELRPTTQETDPKHHQNTVFVGESGTL